MISFASRYLNSHPELSSSKNLTSQILVFPDSKKKKQKLQILKIDKTWIISFYVKMKKNCNIVVFISSISCWEFPRVFTKKTLVRHVLLIFSTTFIHPPLLRLIESRWISLSSIILLISDKTRILRESIKFTSCNYDAE